MEDICFRPSEVASIFRLGKRASGERRHLSHPATLNTVCAALDQHLRFLHTRLLPLYVYLLSFTTKSSDSQ